MDGRVLRSLFASGSLICGVIFFTYETVTRLPPSHSLFVVLLGQGLYWTVIATPWLGGAVLPGGGLSLTPWMQLLLWVLGLVGIVLATDGFTWFFPPPAIWLALAIVHTLVLRHGLLQLLQRLGARA